MSSMTKPLRFAECLDQKFRICSEWTEGPVIMLISKYRLKGNEANKITEKGY